MRLHRTLTLVLVAVLFFGTLLVRLPAAWITGWLPAALQCDGPGGTLWNGYCTRLRIQGITWNGLRWQLHPLPLLTGAISAGLYSIDPTAPGQAQVRLRHGELSIRALQLDLPPTLSAMLLPPGWSGALSFDVSQATLQQQRLQSLQGTATVMNLRSLQPALDLGALRLQVPPQSGEPLHGTFADLGDGPLAVNGTVQLQPATGHYELAGTVAARVGASDDMKKMLTLLGAPDAQGRYRWSLAGSL